MVCFIARYSKVYLVLTCFSDSMTFGHKSLKDDMLDLQVALRYDLRSALDQGSSENARLVRRFESVEGIFDSDGLNSSLLKSTFHRLDICQ